MEPKGYLLQIIDKGKVIAEAPLIVHDPEKAWAIFAENFGMLAHMLTGGFYNTVRVACDEKTLAQVGPQTAIKLEVQSPIVPVNGKLVEVPR